MKRMNTKTDKSDHSASAGLISRVRRKFALALVGLAHSIAPREKHNPKASTATKPRSSSRQSSQTPKSHEGLDLSLEYGLSDRIAYEPINVNATFHNGHLYYPIQTLVRVPQVSDRGGAEFREQTEVVVIRSDRTVHQYQVSAPAEGSGDGEKVYRLSDGTLIQRPPRANPHGTWSFDSASKYLEGEGGDLDLGGLARSVHQHLYSRIWLPMDDDYWLLTFVAITSYVQSVFDAVPLCLVCGPAGSGKSELGASVAQISANAVMIGQTSPATMMRLIDEAGGLVVIDDLEAIGGRNRGKKEERFSEIAQALKVSYKKSTATKAITDSSRKTTQVLNFFGVKILNNTTGTSGATLGSRMVRVNTQYLPDEEKAAFLQRDKIPDAELIELRNQLHTWAMSHVQQVREAYLESVTDRTMREEEIAAPLRVLAKLAGDQRAIKALDRALEKEDLHSMEPDDLLLRVTDKLIFSGQRAVSPQHILLEMRLAYSQDSSSKQLDWLKSEWVGRRLRQLKIISEQTTRRRVNGSQLRVSNVEDAYLSQLARKHDGLQGERDALAFCETCSSCPYQKVKCEIAEKRFKRAG